MLLHSFNCEYHCKCGNRYNWTCSWDFLYADEEIEWIRIYGKTNYFDIVVCISENIPTFLCVTNYDVSAPFQNSRYLATTEEHLLNSRLSREDVTTIITGLKDCYITENA